MRFLVMNLLLSIVWMFLIGIFSMGSLLIGFAVGFLIIFLGQTVIDSGPYVRSVIGSFHLLGVYFVKLVLANIQLARDILRPKPQIKGGFIRFDARALKPAETVLLANMVSLTPGTLTVDTDDDGRYLYIHTVYAQDPEVIRSGVLLFANLIHRAVGGEGSGGHGGGSAAEDGPAEDGREEGA